MRKLGIVPFRLACGSSEPLLECERDFYGHVASALVGEPVQFIQCHPIPSVVITTDTLNHRPTELYGLFHDALRALAQDAEVILVDVDIAADAVVRGAVSFHVACAILAVVKEVLVKATTTQLLVVLFRQFPEEGNAFFDVLARPLEDGRLILISDAADVLPEGLDLPHFHADQYRLQLSEIRRRPIELMRLKMICQPGHFKRDRHATRPSCVRYFYDGRFCSSEIRSLLTGYLRDQYMDSQKPLVLSHCTLSDWLLGPLNLWATEQDLLCFSIHEFLAQERTSVGAVKPMLVVPLVDTCQTIVRVLDQLAERAGIRDINVVSILSTKGASEAHGVRQLPGGHEFRYFLHVPQARFSPEESPCPMCRLELPFTREGVEECLQVTTFDFWEMVAEKGIKDEQNVPSNRLSLGKVPDFPAIIADNGAWLAKKISELLVDTSQRRLRDTVIVCPDQTGAQLLSEYLRVVSGVTVIRIPDDVVTSLRENADVDELSSTWERQLPEWYLQLRTAAASEVVLMDEFSVSSGTRRALERLVRHCHKKVLCHFSLADFCPTESEALEAVPLCLYEWCYWQALTGALWLPEAAER